MNLERTESGKPWMNEILIIAQLRYPCVLPPRKIKEHRNFSWVFVNAQESKTRQSEPRRGRTLDLEIKCSFFQLTTKTSGRTDIHVLNFLVIDKENSAFDALLDHLHARIHVQGRVYYFRQTES